MIFPRCLFSLLAISLFSGLAFGQSDPLAWPPVTREARPWTRWWWMGSAVNAADLTRELTRYQKAGLGGVEITPIYGVKGREKEFIDYLSPQWMGMLKHSVKEAQRLDLGVDLDTGTGWCMGGPNVSETDANALVVATKTDTGFDITQKFSGVIVKRPAPGGAGPMLNLLYPDAMTHYLQRFTDAFAKYDGPKPRAWLHDSYEYNSEWAPDFFEQFQKRRGYDLHAELTALFGTEENDHTARVKSDYRETISDVMTDGSLPIWNQWTHSLGMLSREQAHGSPGNLLDLYAVADIPETEMFFKDRNPLIAKFASSAAHVTGRNLASSETGTWVAEHFHETLADLKVLIDDMLISGINHVLYHGTAYSPDDAAWPGWCFYASTELNPRNSIWHDLPALNAYVTRSQSVLQAGRPDNDILLYWPIHDRWHDAKGLVQNFSIGGKDWFDNQPIGKTARQLWAGGYCFDYISNRQLASVKVKNGTLVSGGNTYRVIVVPPCEHLPLETLRTLRDLASGGATVIFENQLPQDVPGAFDLEKRRSAYRNLLADLPKKFLVGEIESLLAQGGVKPEPLAAHPGIHLVRRILPDGEFYFIANRGTQPFDDFVALAKSSPFSVIMDPLSGRAGQAETRNNGQEIRLQLEPGESVILHGLASVKSALPSWSYLLPTGDPVELKGEWQVQFLEGGPVLPEPCKVKELTSWTQFGGETAQAFAGTARYTLTFDAPAAKADRWLLDLGKVCQSARMRLNGKDLGPLIIAPFRVPIEPLQARHNQLEIEVTNTAANRIRDLDIRRVPWKIFQDINIVNLDYKPLDASSWPLADSGLLGPVRLIPSH